MDFNKILSMVLNKIDYDKISLDRPEDFMKQLFFLNFKEHSLFLTLMNNYADPASVGRILSPFYFAVFNWAEHLKKLHQNLDNNANAKLVYDNICDELGEENGITDLEKIHATTFVNFLHSLGFSGQLKLANSVKTFNCALADLFDKNISYHLCILAGVEYFYIEISKILSNYCLRRRILQEHYQVHETLDFKHATDFLKVAQLNNYSKEDLVHGIINGYILLWNVFDELFEEYLIKIDDSI